MKYPFARSALWTVVLWLSAMVAGHAAGRGTRPHARLPDGHTYIQNEIKFVLAPEFAQSLSPVGEHRRAVELARLLELHPAIVKVHARQSASRNWVEGRALPGRLKVTGDRVPRAARCLTAVLKPGTDAAAVLQEFRALDSIELAGLNVVYELGDVPNDPDYTNTAINVWAPRLIGAEAAWDVTPATSSIRIAIVDCGVDMQHPEFNNLVVYHEGFGDFETGQAPMDGLKGASHGTHVAGIAAAIRNNRIAGVGIATARLIVMNCASWNDDKKAYGIVDGDEAIIEAVSQGADVINCSFGHEGDLDPFMSLALEVAADERVMVVVAAGNADANASGMAKDITGTSWDQHPHPFIVSNTTSTDTLSTNSNFGDGIDLAAPGTQIWSTIARSLATGSVFTNGYMSGTSMAAPHVTGAAAMLLSMNPSRLDDTAVKDLLRRMANDLVPGGKDSQFGWGRLRLQPDFLRTLKAADAFVGSSAGGFGSYHHPYPTIEDAFKDDPTMPHEDPGATIVFTGYPASFHATTLTTPMTLMTFPDRPITLLK